METRSTPFTPYEMPRAPLTMFQQRLPLNDNLLHFLVPAGIGDNLWIISKLWQVCQERDVTFWLPEGEQKRSGDLFRMMDLRVGYMQNLTTEWVWSRPGSPPIPDTGAVLSIQPNKHLENGHRIEKWYPEYEFRNPMDFATLNVASFQREAGQHKYVVCFMSQQGYMEVGGNLKPGQWARICQMLEKEVGPVCLIGAGQDIGFAEEVLKIFDPTIAPVFNARLDQVATLMAGAEMVVGVASGPLIMATYMNIPTLHAYPRWLAAMPGTWEAEENVWGACFLDELEEALRPGVQFNGNRDIGRMRETLHPNLKVTYAFGTKPAKWQPAKQKVPEKVEKSLALSVCERCGHEGCGDELGQPCTECSKKAGSWSGHMVEPATRKNGHRKSRSTAVTTASIVLPEDPALAEELSALVTPLEAGELEEVGA